MRLIKISAPLAVAALLVPFADAKRPLRPNDYYAIDSAADPQISPDGKLVAYAVASVEGKLYKRRSSIWIAPADGSRPPWKFSGEDSSKAPRWSPDGKSLAFLSARYDSVAGAQQRDQIYLAPLQGGEGHRLTSLKNGVTAFEWSPDGRRIACVSRIGKSDTAPPNKESDVREILHPIYKLDGVGFYDDRRSHIWIVDAASGAARQLSSGDTRNDTDPRWSPDGARILYITERTDKDMLCASELFVAPVDGGAPAEVKTPGCNVHVGRWSHDGRRIAYIAAADEANIPKLIVSPSDGGSYSVIGKTITYPLGLDWGPSDNELFFIASHRGESPISRVDLKSGRVTTLTTRGAIRQFDLNEAGKLIAYTGGDDTHPGNLFVMPLDGQSPRQLTQQAGALLADVELQPIERLPFKAADGLDIEFFFVKPYNWREGQSYPMIVQLHGGPNGMWGPAWNFEAQSYAAHGWAVLLPNPRGSSGYGEAFQRGVNKEWGGKAYQDIMKGVDTAIAKYPWIDANRLGVTGQSFGGFMTDWIVGQTTRFKGAATLAGISDFISVEGTRDAYYGHSRDFGGDIWDAFDLYWRYSPIRNAAKVKTPTIILHGEVDHRVPISQGEEFFRALSHFGVPAELVIFPREGHSIRSEPKHAVELLKWQIYWFERWVEGNQNAVKPNDPTPAARAVASE